MPSTLTLAKARAIADAALDFAAKQGIRVSVAVVDAEQHDLLVVRMDAAAWLTTGVARAKARTAVAFRRDSAALTGMKEAYPEVFQLAGDQLPFRPTTLPGGILLAGGVGVAGAVGVSGATPDQDVLCAQAGVAAWAHIS